MKTSRKALLLLALFAFGPISWAQDPQTYHYDVNNETQLTAAVSASTGWDVTITLTADITLTDRLSIPENSQSVTIDLNGHTLRRNLAANDYAAYHMVIHVLDNGMLTVNDGSGTNAGRITGGRAWGGGGIYCEQGSTLTFNGGTVTGNTVTNSGGSGIGGGIFVHVNATATINGGVIIGNSAVQGGGIYNAGTLTIADGVVISGNTAGDGGGIFNNTDATLNINGGTITGNQATTFGGGGVTNYGTLNMTGGAITYNTSTTAGGGIWNGATLKMQGSPVVSGNVSDANGTDNVYLNDGHNITVTGALTGAAEIGVRPSNTSSVFTSGYTTYHNYLTYPNAFFSDVEFCRVVWNFDNNLAKNEIILRHAAGNWTDEGNRAASFSNVNGNTVTITREAEFALMAYNVNNGNEYYGTTFVLGTDLDMSYHYWTPIGGAGHPFRGNFNGNGHTIKGIFVDNPTGSFNGLFGYVWGDSFMSGSQQLGSDYIKNFVLRNSFIKGGDYTGGVVGSLQFGLTLENVVCQADVTGGAKVGGIIGNADAPEAYNQSQYYAYIKNSLFLSGKVTATGIKAAVIGTIGSNVHRSNLYYVAPTSAVGNDYDVRAYPIIESIPEGVTVSYGAGVDYNGIHYHPAGTVNLTERHDLNQAVTVEVNGTQLVGSDGHYSFSIDPAVTEPYELSVTASPSPIAGSGTEALPYLIDSQEDWNYVADWLNGGYASNNFNGVHFQLAVDNITIDQQMGTNDHPFCGTFDGGGHTLTLAFGSEGSYSNQECSPFYRLNNATIKNLVIAGHIYSSAQHNAGIAAKATGNNNHIQNCVSNVSLHSNRSGSGDAGDCTNGGFIGIINTNNTHVYFEGCAFTGELLGTETRNWGGFVGWREYATPGLQYNWNCNFAHFTNCLFAPTKVSIATPDGSNSRPFCRGPEATGAEYTNSYYSNALQGAFGGKQARSITGGADVTVANAGEPSSTTTIGVIGYGTGIKYNNVLYAGNGDNVSLNLSYSGALDPYGYLASAGTLSGTANPYTLAMPNEDVEINAVAGITRVITGYGDSEKVGWAFIASPVNGSIAPTAVGNIFSATEYDLYRLNTSNLMWENYKDHEGNAAVGFNLVNGRGYLYATKETKTLVFTGAFNGGASKTIEDLPQGFCLLGNPFTTNAYVDRSYYTLNENGSAIVAEPVGSTEAILPCYGVIVEVGETGSVTFTTTPPTQQSGNNGGLNIALSQMGTRDTGLRDAGREALIDNAIVTFNEGSELGKFYFGEQNANIYIPQNGKEYAIAYSERIGEMPLNFKARKNGEYSLTVSTPFTSHLSPFTYLHLIDNLTGADIDLLATPSYTFTAKTSDYASRFRLVFVANENENDDENFAFINNGEIIVETPWYDVSTIQVIDMLGHVLLTREVTPHSSLPTPHSSGVYVLRLINNGNVRTQKIVIE